MSRLCLRIGGAAYEVCCAAADRAGTRNLKESPCFKGAAEWLPFYGSAYYS